MTEVATSASEDNSIHPIYNKAGRASDGGHIAYTYLDAFKSLYSSGVIVSLCNENEGHHDP